MSLFESFNSVIVTDDPTSEVLGRSTNNDSVFDGANMSTMMKSPKLNGSDLLLARRRVNTNTISLLASSSKQSHFALQDIQNKLRRQIYPTFSFESNFDDIDEGNDPIPEERSNQPILHEGVIASVFREKMNSSSNQSAESPPSPTGLTATMALRASIIKSLRKQVGLSESPSKVTIPNFSSLPPESPPNRVTSHTRDQQEVSESATVGTIVTSNEYGGDISRVNTHEKQIREDFDRVASHLPSHLLQAVSSIVVDPAAAASTSSFYKNDSSANPYRTQGNISLQMRTKPAKRPTPPPQSLQQSQLRPSSKLELTVPSIRVTSTKDTCLKPNTIRLLSARGTTESMTVANNTFNSNTQNYNPTAFESEANSNNNNIDVSNHNDSVAGNFDANTNVLEDHTEDGYATQNTHHAREKTFSSLRPISAISKRSNINQASNTGTTTPNRTTSSYNIIMKSTPNKSSTPNKPPISSVNKSNTPNKNSSRTNFINKFDSNQNNTNPFLTVTPAGYQISSSTVNSTNSARSINLNNNNNNNNINRDDKKIAARNSIYELAANIRSKGNSNPSISAIEQTSDCTGEVKHEEDDNNNNHNQSIPSSCCRSETRSSNTIEEENSKPERCDFEQQEAQNADFYHQTVYKGNDYIPKVEASNTDKEAVYSPPVQYGLANSSKPSPSKSSRHRFAAWTAIIKTPSPASSSSHDKSFSHKSDEKQLNELKSHLTDKDEIESAPRSIAAAALLNSYTSPPVRRTSTLYDNKDQFIEDKAPPTTRGGLNAELTAQIAALDALVNLAKNSRIKSDEKDNEVNEYLNLEKDCSPDVSSPQVLVPIKSPSLLLSPSVSYQFDKKSHREGSKIENTEESLEIYSEYDKKGQSKNTTPEKKLNFLQQDVSVDNLTTHISFAFSPQHHHAPPFAPSSPALAPPPMPLNPLAINQAIPLIDSNGDIIPKLPSATRTRSNQSAKDNHLDKQLFQYLPAVDESIMSSPASSMRRQNHLRGIQHRHQFALETLPHAHNSGVSYVPLGGTIAEFSSYGSFANKVDNHTNIPAIIAPIRDADDVTGDKIKGMTDFEAINIAEKDVQFKEEPKNKNKFLLLMDVVTDNTKNIINDNTVRINDEILVTHKDNSSVINSVRSITQINPETEIISNEVPKMNATTESFKPRIRVILPPQLLQNQAPGVRNIIYRSSDEVCRLRCEKYIQEAKLKMQT